MIGQMTIFDFLPVEYPDINDVDEREAVRIVGEQLGITFTYNKRFEEWEYKKGRIRLSLEYDHFNLDDNHELFFGAGYNISGGTHEGGGSPCSSIESVVEYLKAALKKVGLYGE